MKSPINLEELIRLSDAATPGEYSTEFCAHFVASGKRFVAATHMEEDGVSLRQSLKNAEFFAAANPSTVKCLAQAVVKMREELKQISLFNNSDGDPSLEANIASDCLTEINALLNGEETKK